MPKNRPFQNICFIILAPILISLAQNSQAKAESPDLVVKQFITGVQKRDCQIILKSDLFYNRQLERLDKYEHKKRASLDEEYCKNISKRFEKFEKMKKCGKITLRSDHMDEGTDLLFFLLSCQDYNYKMLESRQNPNFSACMDIYVELNYNNKETSPPNYRRIGLSIEFWRPGIPEYRKIKSMVLKFTVSSYGMIELKRVIEDTITFFGK